MLRVIGEDMHEPIDDPEQDERRRRKEASQPRGLVGRASPKAPRFYRFLLMGCRAIARILGFRLRLEGAERLPTGADGRPAGAWIAAGIPHRTWIDPFVL